MTQFIEPLTQPASLDLKKLNQKFEKSHPKDILTWCLFNIPSGLVQTSAFNVDDMLITDLLYRDLRPTHPVPVLFLDTLHHFPQTLDLVAKAKAIYDLNLKIYKIPGIKTREAFAAKYGQALWEKDIEQFSQLTKIEPLQRGLKELDTIAWITGRRRDQASTRSDMPIFELDAQKRLKVNPLANWTRKETWAYVFEHDVIYNPLHDQGYPSIGDEPLTTPVRDGEDERVGRWRDLGGKTECGIHGW
ncbi:MAG: phosphoadenosine phosphosulfate reductase [Oscillatoriales cyanobacterium C42_A2020_001]|nr:phosphoadenosine phosphosulfate reductase [Leptolyngbyaceae cyanobacterium C42_A2020_001]